MVANIKTQILRKGEKCNFFEENNIDDHNHDPDHDFFTY